MTSLGRINRKLHTTFGNAVIAQDEDGCVVLHGELPCWEDVVRAGRMAVNRHRDTGVVNDISCPENLRPPMRIPPFSDRSLEGRSPDVLIIGGGVVGCAVARELTRWKLRRRMSRSSAVGITSVIGSCKAPMGPSGPVLCLDVSRLNR